MGTRHPRPWTQYSSHRICSLPPACPPVSSSGTCAHTFLCTSHTGARCQKDRILALASTLTGVQAWRRRGKRRCGLRFQPLLRPAEAPPPPPAGLSGSVAARGPPARGPLPLGRGRSRRCRQGGKGVINNPRAARPDAADGDPRRPWGARGGVQTLMPPTDAQQP